MTLAWAVRTVMVVVTALSTYLLANAQALQLDQWQIVLIGAIPVIAAALNASTVADKITSATGN